MSQLSGNRAAGGGSIRLHPTAVGSVAPWGRDRSDGLLKKRLLFLKLDGKCSDLFGGNKARKLALLLDQARRLGKDHLVVLGHEASHTVLATCRLGIPLGFKVTAYVTPFPRSEYARGVLAAIHRTGAEVIRVTPWRAWFLRLGFLVGWEKRKPFPIPVGASNFLSLHGFHDAPAGMACGDGSGITRAPDAVVVPLASGGTALGLGLALADAKARTRVLAVPVAGGGVRPHLNLLSRWVPLLFRSPLRAFRALGRIRLLMGYAGEGYGRPSPLGTWATHLIPPATLFLDPIYGAKACAAALHQVRLGLYPTVLFWQTGPAFHPAGAIQPQRGIGNPVSSTDKKRHPVGRRLAGKGRKSGGLRP